jgi:leader peptidase (prepilin peptidase) / N-methyltransferase
VTGYGVLSAYLIGLTGVLGLVVGSFLNVVVHRVPAGVSVVNPPSACPGCGHHVRARDNIPVVSWLLLRGRCRDCETPISARYPAVEAGTALAFVAMAWHFSDPVVVAAGLVFAAAGISLALIDLEHQRLPFAITGVTAVLVLLIALAGSLTGAATFSWSTLALSAGLWWALYAGLRLVSRGRGMGLGDVALAPVLGVVVGLVGLGASVVGLLAGPVLATLLLYPLRLTGRLPRRTRVPYGPFLVAGGALGLVLGPEAAELYLGLLGLR